MIAHQPGAEISQVAEAEYEAVTQAIVASISKLEGCSWSELPPLFGSIEATALDALFSGSAPHQELSVELILDEYAVRCEKSELVTARRIE